MPRSSSPHGPAVLLALGAAALFGVTTPLVSWLGEGTSAFAVAALLYAGASGFAALMAGLGRGATPLPWRVGRPLARRDAGALLGMALLGAALAPVLLALGLERTGPTSASLALNAEALFTALLATWLGREPWHRDLVAGLVCIGLGGVLLTLDAVASPDRSHNGALGLLLVLGATLAWGLDNVLSRAVSEARPLVVVACKGALGATASLGVLLMMLTSGHALPSGRAWLLLAVGATGYGASLVLYLLAQRRLGAARTGSIFGVGPFFGAAVAFLAGDRALGPLALAAVPLMALGVWLHARERHEHEHLHEALEHEHAHRHDDGHHDHEHDHDTDGGDPTPDRQHSHRHRHAPLTHRHAHSPDLHHRHRH